MRVSMGDEEPRNCSMECILITGGRGMEVGRWGCFLNFIGGLTVRCHLEFQKEGLLLMMLVGTKPSKDIIRAEVDALNAPSMGLIKKMGFTRGEDKKGSYQLGSDIRDGTGVWRDTVVWSLERPGFGAA